MKIFRRMYNKVTRIILMIVIALILAFIGYRVVTSSVQSQVITAPVLVAKGNITPYQELTADNTQVVQKVLSEIPEDAVEKFTDLKVGDSFASNLGFINGVPIQKAYVTTATQSKLGTSVGLAKGMNELGVTTDLIMSAGGEIQPGTLVDVVASFKDSRTNEITTVTDPTLTNIKVIKMKNSEGLVIDPTSSSSQVPAVSILEVNDMQAKKIVDFQEKGKVYLLLTGIPKK